MSDIDVQPKPRRKWLAALLVGLALVAGWFYWWQGKIDLLVFLTSARFEGIQLTGSANFLEQPLSSLETTRKKASLTFQRDKYPGRGTFQMSFDGHDYTGEWNVSGPFINMSIWRKDGVPFGGGLSFRPPRYVDDPFVAYSIGSPGRGPSSGILLLRNVGDPQYWQTGEPGSTLRPSRIEIVAW